VGVVGREGLVGGGGTSGSKEVGEGEGGRRKGKKRRRGGKGEVVGGMDKRKGWEG